MSSDIVLQAERVTLVGGGTVYPGDLGSALALAPKACAADSGADALLAAQVTPEVVIGDFDSLSGKARAAIAPQSLVQVTEQDSTDFEKALMRIDARVVLGVGFTGGRLDHAAACWHTMLRFAHKPVILLARSEIILLAPPRLSFDLPEGTTVSLFPLARCSGRSRGLRWPIDGLKFEAGDQIGTSNRALGGQIDLDMDQPGTLLFLPKSALGTLTQALSPDGTEPARWPARA